MKKECNDKKNYIFEEQIGHTLFKTSIKTIKQWIQSQ
jgi:hypothetical protein